MKRRGYTQLGVRESGSFPGIKLDNEEPSRLSRDAKAGKCENVEMWLLIWGAIRSSRLLEHKGHGRLQ